MSQALKVGYERYRMVHVWWGKKDRSGMPADVQACWHNPNAHVQSFFPPKVQKQMTVTSLDDVPDILLTYIGGGIKGSTHETKGGSLDLVLSMVQLFGLCLGCPSRKPQTL